RGEHGEAGEVRVRRPSDGPDLGGRSRAGTRLRVRGDDPAVAHGKVPWRSGPEADQIDGASIARLDQQGVVVVPRELVVEEVVSACRADGPQARRVSGREVQDEQPVTFAARPEVGAPDIGE